MTERRSALWHPAVVASAAVALVAFGAVGSYLVMRERPPATVEPAASPGPPAGAVAAGSVVTLTPDLLKRADLEIVPARRSAASSQLRVPASVLPDAYRQAVVRAAAGGRVLAVSAELGQHVQAGQVLARVHSPEVAEVERTYRSAVAQLSAVDRQLERLERLVSIGAASRQELEATQAERVRLISELDNARARLQQLGRSAESVAKELPTNTVSAAVAVPAPVTGTITKRSVNPGENIDASAELFTIVDLSTVWVIGEVYERDLSRVRIGSTATITSASIPGETVRGRVSYVDPQVAETTRTAQVRVDVRNPGGRLKLGTFGEMVIDVAAPAAVLVPETAVQTVDQTDVVYVAIAGEAGRFAERSVRVGVRVGREVEIVAGLAEGDRVVARGSFFLRSERDRQNLAAPVPVSSTPVVARAEPAEAVIVRVSVGAAGFSPEQINVPAGRRVRLIFTRTAESTCATEVVLPALNIKAELPLNKPVTIDVPPQPEGKLAFACGMNMFRGQLVVTRAGG